MKSAHLSPVAALAGAGALATYGHDRAAARRRLDGFDVRTAQTRTGPVDYCEFGAGPPVLMIHGIVGGHDVGPTWRSLVGSGYRVIAPSRFGYFGTPLPAEATPAMQADAFADLLDTLRIDEVVLFGFSAGSTSSVQMALRHPDRLRALVLACPNAPHPEPPALPPRVLAPLLFSQPAFWALRRLARPALERLAGVPAGYPRSVAVDADIDAVIESFYPMAPRAAGSVFDAYVGNPAIADCPLEEVAVPTLVLQAQDDPMAPHDDTEALARRIPGSCFVSLPRGGHVLMHRERAALDAVAEFLGAYARGDDALSGAVAV